MIVFSPLSIFLTKSVINCYLLCYTILCSIFVLFVQILKKGKTTFFVGFSPSSDTIKLHIRAMYLKVHKAVYWSNTHPNHWMVQELQVTWTKTRSCGQDGVQITCFTLKRAWSLRLKVMSLEGFVQHFSPVIPEINTLIGIVWQFCGVWYITVGKTTYFKGKQHWFHCQNIRKQM